MKRWHESALLANFLREKKFQAHFSNINLEEGCLQDIACLYLLIFSRPLLLNVEHKKKAQNTKISSSLRTVSVQARASFCTTHGADYKANFPNRSLSTLKKIELQYICLFGYIMYTYIEQYILSLLTSILKCDSLNTCYFYYWEFNRSLIEHDAEIDSILNINSSHIVSQFLIFSLFLASISTVKKEEVEMRVQFVFMRINFRILITNTVALQRGKRESERGIQNGEEFSIGEKAKIYFYFCCASLVMVPRFFQLLLIFFLSFFFLEKMIWILKEKKRRKRWNTKTHFIILKVFLFLILLVRFFFHFSQFLFLFHKTI